ncbi:MAG: hypothetical protein J5J00_02225 [Deltaproteobacteria bacterium]|nr:hypothetical protein [Deltaproteobacteria bacterium]
MTTRNKEIVLILPVVAALLSGMAPSTPQERTKQRSYEPQIQASKSAGRRLFAPGRAKKAAASTLLAFFAVSRGATAVTPQHGRPNTRSN